MQTSAIGPNVITPSSGQTAVVASTLPRLLVTTPDTGLMLRISGAAESAGWWACWRPDATFEPEGGLAWDAIAVDADFGLTALLQANASRCSVLGIVGWWDARGERLQGVCQGFIHRPIRTTEVLEALTTVRYSVQRPARRRA